MSYALQNTITKSAFDAQKCIFLSEFINFLLLIHLENKINWFSFLNPPYQFSVCKAFFRSTKTVRVLTEELVYPFPSFLAEFGGALGLFLGFSIFMVWDMIIFCINGTRKIMKKSL